MKIVFVSRSNTGYPYPYVKEQADALVRNYNVEISHFLVAHGGVSSYLKAVIKLFDFTRKNRVDLIHVHCGLSALVAVLYKYLFFKKLKIIITFHGSDINIPKERKYSLFAAQFSSHNILVSEKMLKYFKKKYSIIPCGIETNIKLDSRENTRIEKGWEKNDFVILFSAGFHRKVKDPQFAFKVIEAFSNVTKRKVRFIEMKGFTRNEVTNIMQAADVMLMCSFTEGSPQVIKEAILNSLPVISNDVGEVRLICSGVDNCYIIQKTVTEYVRCLKFLSQANARIQNRFPVIEKFDNNIISKKIFGVYSEVLNEC
ncbi:glycosyltransferase family 4 protein [Flavisolibacter ginsengisoli]|jgi:glycosyltransferase involved in cell wall biosynthesis|uniref:Glycosyltransferase involved in cell wall bisynthesis n=1 Tax=Flavisolibacter ginsengisoli DSM 18119 TaxID=1121884 RepID=A0A1M5B9G7_9BACT|nr:glycosyltransferase family 4 protein [Flavisolibacter ginsengisoli]SHF39201.1 Glycosyltransferase involved in cell wall bisynthesis [Flavisolibacter ginsengisoli DSM 18119]